MVLGWTMDPQSFSFTPQDNDIWRLSNAMRAFQDTQQDHGDRLSRLERQRDEDARVKSVWGTASPFPGVLGGTPQHGSTHHPTVDFANFDDDQSNSMVRSLHLDADDEPRRFGASRANSVRFDDSAKPGQWAHATRSSVDLPARASSGLSSSGGGHPLWERSASHKSDGRSSIGQAAISSRANSLMLDTGSQPYTPAAEEPPSLAPGLLILGSVPSIIRCWLDDNFKHDTLLYAAVCTGSYKSYLDSRMVEYLGLSGHVCQDLSGDRKIKVAVYLPEAVPIPTSSRSSSPSNRSLPAVTVDFTVIERSERHTNSKAIQIFLGSDLLRAHNADILFSSNTLTLFDDDRSKLSIPLVRPENDETFKALFCTSAAPTISRFRPGLALDTKSSFGLSNGVGSSRPQVEQAEQVQTQPLPAPAQPLSQQEETERENRDDSTIAPTRDDITPRPIEGAKSERFSFEPRRSTELREAPVEETGPSSSSSSRTTSSPAIWSSWRRDGSSANTTPSSSSTDWASRNGTATRPTRDQGIKVLKPARQVSRSNASPLPGSPVTSGGQSRFFDDGRRRNGPSEAAAATGTSEAHPSVRRSMSGESARAVGREGREGSGSSAQSALGTGAPPKSVRSANPIGGASAFGWLNPGASK